MLGGELPQSAKEVIDALMARRNTLSIDWEGVLARQYIRLLQSPRTIIDVGAHQGIHSAHFANIGARRVICFEPIPVMAAALREMLAGYPVEVHAVALGIENGQSDFVHNLTVPGESGLKERQPSATGQQERETLRVETRRLDNFGFSEVDFIKIDCEGGELNVLRGGERTIAEQRPVISVEYGWASYSVYGVAKNDLLDWAIAQHYTISDLFGRSITDSETYDYCVDRYYWDFFLVPNEKWAAVEAMLRAADPLEMVGVNADEATPS